MLKNRQTSKAMWNNQISVGVDLQMKIFEKKKFFCLHCNCPQNGPIIIPHYLAQKIFLVKKKFFSKNFH